ncbi:MAG TPA: VWA domain-containing protein [Methanosarcina sp.]|nr:VWA domain-containing protein [Methanosarcina sp.]
MDTLNLTKAQAELDLNLTKASVLTIPKMPVRLAMDVSGSMESNFRTGFCEKILGLFSVFALKFDDNGRLEFGTYNTSYRQQEDVTSDNYEGYLTYHSIHAEGGTLHVPPLLGMLGNTVAARSVSAVKGFFKKVAGVQETVRTPTYNALMTDGDAPDAEDFCKRVAALDKRDFIHIICIGTQVSIGNFDRIANLPNVAVVHFPNPLKVTMEDFYSQMVTPKFGPWINSL